MESRHNDEAMVQETLKFPRKSTERKHHLQKLLRLGNYKHNVEVLRDNKGDIVTARQPVGENSTESFEPCEHCFTFFL